MDYGSEYRSASIVDNLGLPALLASCDLDLSSKSFVLSFDSGDRIKLREVYLLSAQRFARHRRHDTERCGVQGRMRP